MTGKESSGWAAVAGSNMGFLGNTGHVTGVWLRGGRKGSQRAQRNTILIQCLSRPPRWRVEIWNLGEDWSRNRCLVTRRPQRRAASAAKYNISSMFSPRPRASSRPPRYPTPIKHQTPSISNQVVVGLVRLILFIEILLIS